MNFPRTCVSWRVRIVNDGLISHELSDDVGQLAWVREIDRVGRSVNGDEDDAVFYLFRDFLDACWTRHQRVATAGNHQRWHIQGKQPVQRWIPHERPEHPERAGNAET
jgi:hypothetical protein